MKAEFTAGGVATLAGIAAVGGLGLWLYANRKEIASAVNPASDKNLVYQAANTVTQAVTGQKGASFGSWLYDVFHPDQVDITATVYPKDAWDKVLERKAADVYTPPPPTPAEQNYVQGSLFGPPVMGPNGRMEMTLANTPTIWWTIAGVSMLMYLHKQQRR